LIVKNKNSTKINDNQDGKIAIIPLLHNFTSKYNLLLLTISLILISIVLSKGVFIKATNINNLLLQNCIVGIIAMGQFLVILTGGFDLSVGSILSASSMLAASLFYNNVCGIFTSIFLSIIFATFLGLANGVLVTKGKIPPFIATLGMMEIAKSIGFQLNNGSSIWEIPKDFILFWETPIFYIPVPLIVWAVIFFCILILTENTSIGRFIYAIGTNERAAVLSGVRVEKIKLIVYTISGILCGIAGLISIGRFHFASPISGTGYSLDSITAVLIGGTNIFGGEGKAVNVLLGVIIMSVIVNLMNIMGVDIYLQNTIKGAILLSVILYGKIYKF